ncbi:DUF6221 family protein [Streptomyces sp. NPDC001553]|uniref:DUF6221 family protein n=1 Tax=Streptomyces sp. NPDC001553 TaxID=3154385 RepID=UPI003321AC29
MREQRGCHRDVRFYRGSRETTSSGCPDPARVLREVAAKRRILAPARPRPPWPCYDRRDLASPHTGHPDFPSRV